MDCKLYLLSNGCLKNCAFKSYINLLLFCSAIHCFSYSAQFRSCNSLKLCNECSIFHLQKYAMLGLCNMNFDFFSVSSVHKCPQICVNIFMITLFYLQLHWIYMREWLPEVMPAQMKQTFYAQNKWSKDYSSNCRSLSN